MARQERYDGGSVFSFCMTGGCWKLMVNVSISDLGRLRGAATWRCRQAFRPGTRANRKSQVLLYIAFTIHFKLQDFPAQGNTLLAYGEFLLRSYRTGKSVTNAFSLFSTFHAMHGFTVQGFANHKVQLFRRALPLTCRSIPVRAPPLPFRVLEQLCQFSAGGGEKGILFAALLASTFFTMARLSSMVPPDGQRFDKTRHLTWDDVRFEGGRVFFRVKWAKTHQAPDQGYWVPLLPVPASAACPVTCLRRARELTDGRSGDTPLFGGGGGGGGGGGRQGRTALYFEGSEGVAQP